MPQISPGAAHEQTVTPSSFYTATLGCKITKIDRPDFRKSAPQGGCAVLLIWRLQHFSNILPACLILSFLALEWFNLWDLIMLSWGGYEALKEASRQFLDEPTFGIPEIEEVMQEFFDASERDGVEGRAWAAHWTALCLYEEDRTSNTCPEVCNRCLQKALRILMFCFHHLSGPFSFPGYR